MRQQAPPLDAAEAFLAAARAPSFRAAADRIALSPSAFSRRIQLLESFVGAPLFDRSGATSILTEAGRRYYAEVAPALDAIRLATQQMRDDASRRRLRVVTSHSLAVGWLLPRLPDLRQRLGIEVELTIGRDRRALASGAADLALWGGMDARGDDACDRLIALEAALAAAPRLIDGAALPIGPGELDRHRLLASVEPHGIWETWLGSLHADAVAPAEMVTYDTTHLTYEAAAAGLGLTLAVPLLADRFIAEGRLRPVFGAPAAIGHDYSVFYATAEIARRRPVRDLAGWLADQASVSLAAFSAWAALPDASTLRLAA